MTRLDGLCPINSTMTATLCQNITENLTRNAFKFIHINKLTSVNGPVQEARFTHKRSEKKITSPTISWQNGIKFSDHRHSSS